MIDRLTREKVATTSVNSNALEEVGEEEKRLERYLEQSKDHMWVSMYRDACQTFTYPKCPQLLTSQGLLNSANRKRVLPEASDPSEKPEKVRKTRRERHRTNPGVRLGSEEKHESTQELVKNSQFEDLWVQAESFAIFDEEENETENDDEEDDEENEILANEWI